MGTRTCARCGATPELDFGYARQPLSGKLLCAPCWERDNVRGLGLFVLFLLAVPNVAGLLSGRTPPILPSLWPLTALLVLYLLVAAHEAGHAVVAHQDRRYGDVWRWATDGLALQPHSPALAGMLGAALIGLGRHREAVEHYAAQLERSDMKPEHRAMHENNLAWAALMSGEPGLHPAALAASDAAHRALGSMPCANGTRGYALILAGDRAEREAAGAPAKLDQGRRDLTRT